jgi:hypothetical protein
MGILFLGGFQIVILNVFELAVLLLLAALSVYYYRYFTRENPQPGPFPLPLIGSLHLYTNPGQLYKRLQHQYGDCFEVWLASERRIVFCRSEFVDRILDRSSTTKFQKRGYKDSLAIIKMASAGIIPLYQ